MVLNQFAETENFEIEILLDVLYRYYGYDFRNYAKASLKRRLQKTLGDYHLIYISEMIPEALHKPEFLQAPMIIYLNQ